ncbi:MAG TPA: 50S ribosomal protein L6 [Fimbriiglobus sp.]|jgi:large subunit ribosomal protein L6
MSRIGKQPVVLPAGVKVSVANRLVKVEGPKGKLEFTHHPGVTVAADAKGITVSRPDDARLSRSLHGTTRALIANMVTGVTTGFEKKLKIEGVGYQAAVKNKAVELTVGFANRVVHAPPEGVSVECPDPTTILVKGIDRQKVGQFAAEIRASKKPEPYKGKGVRYENEVVRRKEGKSFTAGK